MSTDHGHHEHGSGHGDHGGGGGGVVGPVFEMVSPEKIIEEATGHHGPADITPMTASGISSMVELFLGPLGPSNSGSSGGHGGGHDDHGHGH